MSFCNIQKNILICYYNGWAIDSTPLHLKEAKKLNHFVITYRITCKVNYCKIWKIGVGPGEWYQTKEREWEGNKSVLVKYWILFLIRYSFHRIILNKIRIVLNITWTIKSAVRCTSTHHPMFMIIPVCTLAVPTWWAYFLFVFGWHNKF